MSQHQPRGLVPQRISSISSSSNESLSRQSPMRSPLSGLDSILAEHALKSPRYTANNNIIVDPEFRKKFEKTVRSSRQLEASSSSSSFSSRGSGRRPTAANGSLGAGVAETGTISHRELRPRASSPLLGQRYQNQEHEPLPSFDAKVNPVLRPSESSATLRSSRNPLTSPSAVSQQAQAQKHKRTQKQAPASTSTRDLALRNIDYPPTSPTGSNLPTDLEPLQPYLQDQQKKSSKPKHRPPMIDLSKLFPKPSEPAVHPAVPLLSPHRMTMSPSPVSLRSDASSFGSQQRKFGSLSYTANKLTKAPSSKELSALRKHYQQKQQYSQSATQLPPPEQAQSSYQQQKQQQRLQGEQQEKEEYYKRKKREKQQREEEYRRIQQQEREEQYLRQEQERKEKEEEQRRQRELEQEAQRQKQGQRLREQKRRNELQQQQQQQRLKELQSQRYLFPFQEKRNTFRRKAPVEWFDGPEGQISSDEEDDEKVTPYSAHPTPPLRQPNTRESSYSRESSVRSSVNSHAASGLSKASSRTVLLSPGPESAKKLTPDFQSSQSPISPANGRLQPSLHDWDIGSAGGHSVSSPGPASAILSRKSSRTTLNKSDLNEASVLCLSSSEDEAEEEEMVEVKKPVQKRVIRDSIATFDEGGSEIFTAKAIAASRGPSVTKIRNTALPPLRTSRPKERLHTALSREPSTSSSMRSSNYRPSSGIPTISEPESPPPLPSSSSTTNAPTFDFQLPTSRQRRNDYQSAPATNRRSRVIAVTRQEERFLELIRQQQGNVPGEDAPTTSNESRTPIPFTDLPKKPSNPDQQPNSTPAGNPDTSFLALSPGLPPPHSKTHPVNYPVATDPSTNETDSHSSHSHHALSVSDCGGDHNSNPSPRVSLVHSDTIPSPSPSASWASPRTPTHSQYNQHHRFGGLGSGSGSGNGSSAGSQPQSRNGNHNHHKLAIMHAHPLSSYPPTSALPSLPPSTSPPLSPGASGESKRHSRSRTDSSSAMVFGDGTEESKGVADGSAGAGAGPGGDLPIWGLGWGTETPGLAVVH
ncbi:hypothetical protein AJ79_08699 [Helicocarpus griseus UAMH5409]|uniref:Uncharacterized protein n=1 Tax=Helicocarpus griseus UAMH5409 TaxID=1447875 RepID=A0A2B7WQN5_9EURO|nr:hypothetical protein AJ79_08699 [Helicocarpus griseus UAMH5409]